VGDETHTRLERVLRQRNKRKTRSRPRENGGERKRGYKQVRRFQKQRKFLTGGMLNIEEKKILPRR